MEFNFTKKSTARALGKYGLASAMFIAAAPAQAGIVYSGPIETTIFSNSNLPIDLDGNGTDDFSLSANSYISLFPGADVLISALGSNGVTAVSQGTTINQDLSYAPTYMVIKSFFEGTQSANVVAGLKFDIDGATHYGWMRVSGSANSNIPAARAILHDFAYEDVAGASVIAPSAVPEPSSLALLALGAAGVAALKRRRAA